MKSNILYIARYSEDFLSAPALCYQMINQTNTSCLLSIFNSIVVKDTLYNHFIKYSELLKFMNTQNDKPILQQILNNYSKYEWFIFLSSKNLYDSEFSEEISNKIKKNNTQEFIFYPHNHNKIATHGCYAVNRNIFLQTVNLYTNIENMLSDKLKQNTIYSSFSSKSLVYYPSDVSYNHLGLYSDDFCLFAKFLGCETVDISLSDSFVYLNKRNSRVYNIANNIIGYLIDNNNNDNNIRISWLKNDDTLTDINYVFEPITQQYLPI